jgi:hypothetical protein
LSKHARNFGSTSDEIPDLSFLLQLATELNVNLHVNWDKRFPDEWELDFIENRDAAPGSCSHVLRLLTEAADRHGKDIIGCVQNTFDSSLPPEPWLLEWYMNHGFHQIANEVHGVPIRRRRQQSSASVQATPPAG